MAQLTFADQARLDLDDICFYLAERNPGAADRFIDDVRDKCQRLAENPLIGRSQAHRRQGLRSWPVGSYLVFYRPLEGGVEVVRVLHGSRDIDNLF